MYQDRLDVIHGNLMDKVDGKFNIIVANIIADAIIEISKDIKEYLMSRGCIYCIRNNNGSSKRCGKSHKRSRA